MKEMMVLGSGCSKCTKTAALIQAIAKQNSIVVKVVKETRPEIILQFGVMRTPAVVIDNKVVHAGSIPPQILVESWLKNTK
ncbi:MAG: thioredoxin family protein [Paraglaciecola sp.]|uniref:thioredoxin family protein n=1 Tax=Pseudomonadati TaxID=3379134 RepID=UPI00273E1C1B|nr:thioredoxin family protein [Paraglaciecola sp.]MDP5032641.1 thioredoxin family protein [Paraglaciecola sp.]MDP5132181.1 thioredoxin family protein [Paraglaciecola sp.]